MSNGTSMRRRTAGSTWSSMILRRTMVSAIMPPLYDVPFPQPLIGGKAVDATLDIEQHVDAPDCLQCDRRDRACVLAASRIGGDIGQFKELPPGVRPAKRRRDWPRRAGRLVELIVPVIGVG